MPWRSQKQAAWGHSEAGIKALGGPAAVAEWDAATPKGSLMDKPKNWIAGAVKHPGALTAAAKASGRSKMEQAQHDAGSKNKKIAARGRLGERFIKKSI